jgi:hypothetical protein
MLKTLCSLAALAALAGSAAAQVPGPDVIVGDLYDPQNYTTGSAINGMRAYAVGTISCNLGDDPLTWISDNNQHPVISQNMYRLLDGRFEQIGQAWLKHGFCALQGPVCSACTPGGSCPALFPGCSDPYSGGLNGSQGGLGPKSEVNAATGYFPYPWINNGSGDATLKKRLIAPDAKLGNSGALYFVSSSYIQPEDAAFGNDNNNQSYRQATISGANKTLGLTGSTQRGIPAIFAWRNHGGPGGTPDANVQLASIDVANDGRFWIGSKATNNGNGTWTYEYAIQNLNSDRSGRAFSVSFPAGSTVSNVGFNDIDYHSGEPYSNTDWTSNVTSNSITWSGQTHAQNVNANALRWDTIYNFRFTINVPPAGGPGTLTLFKPGTPTSVSTTVVVPSADGQQHPFNDNCAGAAAVGIGATPFDSTGANTDGPDEPGGCVIQGQTQIGADLWYSFTAECSGNLTVSTCGSSFDTKLAVYPGGGCPTGSGQYLACSDDDGGCGLGSQVTLAVTQGSTYLIRVGGYNNAQGTGTLTLSGLQCGPVPPSNDACANASWIAAGTLVNGSTSLATNDGTASCGNAGSSPDVWYKYRPRTGGTVTVETCTGSNYDTVISAHTGACGSLTQIACNDDTCGLQSRITFNGVAGTTYYLRVAGYNGDVGDYGLRVTGGGGVVPPLNDDCASRAGIGLGTLAFDTTGASTDGPALSCSAAGQVHNDIWYNHPATCTGNLTISTCGSAFDTAIQVFDGAGCTNYQSRLLACNNNDSSCGTGSKVTIPVIAGRNYTIRVGGAASANFGAGSITLTCETPTCNADFNGDGFLDFFDYDDYVNCFETGTCPQGRSADFNGDGFIDFFDYDDFVLAYENGC